MAVSPLLVVFAAASVVLAQSPAWGQCGGQGWTGATTCVSGYTCTYSNDWYSQCLPGSSSSSSSSSSSTTTTTTSSSTTTKTTTSSSSSTSSTSTSTPTGAVSVNFETTPDSSIWGVIQSAQSGGSATIDTTKAHSGSHSLKVVSTGGYSNHVFYGIKSLSAVGLGSGDLYGRYYANFQTGFTQDHTTHMWMTDPVAQTLRMGGQFGVLDWNRANDDSIMPDGSPQSDAGSVAIAGNTWYCIEFHLGRSSGQIETWVNGTAVPSLTTPQTRWGSSYKPNPSDWGLGWESYGGAANTVWFDDLAIGPSRIGC